MNRRAFIAFTAASTLINRQSAFGIRPAPKPNVVFILIDDLGWGDVGFMGNEFIETPNIDRIAKEGVVFTNAYCNAPNCAPPAHAS